MSRIWMVAVLAVGAGCAAQPPLAPRVSTAERAQPKHDGDEELDAWLEQRDISGTGRIDELISEVESH